MEVYGDSAGGKEHIDLAKRFGVDLGNQTAPVKAKKYLLAFTQKILLQREKLNGGHLTDYIKSRIIKLWQDVLSTLENSNRKLLDIQDGSLIFTLFCPTISSAQELTNESWIKTLTINMEQLMKEIGQFSQFSVWNYAK